MNVHRISIIICLVVSMILVVGCAQRSEHRKSSVVDYLYPARDSVVVEPDVPRLKLPLNVGIAFVPEGGYKQDALIDERSRMELMKKVRDEFKSYPFVKHIEMIPSAYLNKRGSFDNLNQIKTMFGINVIVLLSYDQVQHTDEGSMSIAYWTLVGAYIVQGEKNETSTMVDAAVYDIKSRKMLFRAPGLSHIRHSSTPVNLKEQLRLDSREGFTLAVDDMIVNLKEQLEFFKDKVKEAPEEYKIIRTPEYQRRIHTGGGGGGGGALEPVYLILATALACLMLAGKGRRDNRGA